MLYALLSPAKRLDFDPLSEARLKLPVTQPALLKETAILIARAKELSRNEIAKLMDLSPKLTELNFERFQTFDPKNRTGAKPALFTFAGDVYVGLNAATLSADDVAFAQEHIGIISGLYGLLRPLDLIQPYRLEMHSALKTERGRDLYAFWQSSLTAHLNDRMAKLKSPVIVNLASTEYWSAVDAPSLRCPVITAAFKEIRNGKAQVISFLAKKARGMMARAIIDQRWNKPDDLKDFDTAGYRFDARASDSDALVFSRKAK